MKTSNGRFAKDSYRRFIQMYSNVVLGIEGHLFEELIDNYKLTKGVLQTQILMKVTGMD